MLKIKFLQQFICRNFNKCLTKWLIINNSKRLSFELIELYRAIKLLTLGHMRR